MNSRSALLASALFVVLLGLCAPVTAQPTAEQLRAFQSLSPSERDALLRSMKRDSVKASKAEPTVDVDTLPAEPVEATKAEPAVLKAPRLKAGDTVLLEFKLTEPRPDVGQAGPFKSLADKRSELPEQRLYVLDQFAAISIPSVGRIILKGLNEAQAAERIQAEPTLKGVTVVVKLLPIEEPLKPFGYDLFTAPRATLTPATDIPVPADYVVGPGDVVLVQLFGKDNAEHELVISRDGNILFPGIGPIPVSGLRFAQLEQQIQNRVQRQLIGVKASVTLGKLRSVRVFVVGDVERPGSYAVSGLATITHALYASGGVRPIGSLRDIQLKRQGKVVTRLDVYDLLLRGDNSKDARLVGGDVIFIPPVGKTVGVAGRVRRPAIYELKEEKSVGELVAMAGGLMPDAFPEGAQIERIADSRARTVMDIDLTRTDVHQTELRDGDVIKVYTVSERLHGVVRLTGHVQRPGYFQWKPGLRLTQLISSLADLKPEADTRYVLVQRESADGRVVSFANADLGAALAKPESEANIALNPRDQVYVFDLRSPREEIVRPLLEQARSRASPTNPVREVFVEGVVHHAGRYPLSNNMRVSDLIYAAGGLTDKAYTLEAELTRFIVVDGKEREQIQQNINLAGVLRGVDEADVALDAYDRLVIRRIPKWEEEGVVELVGQVKFPGRYPI
ncbi:MAG: SLBB domain-containing protein, partial [Pseudomonadota bacterium]